MPRTAFFSKETIAAAGLEIVRRQGVTALTARALSKQLECSLSPIFTVFKDMDEIKGTYQLKDEQVLILYRQLWAFTCGIAVLATQSPDDYPEEMISEMISTQFIRPLR